MEIKKKILIKIERLRAKKNNSPKIKREIHKVKRAKTMNEGLYRLQIWHYY